MRQLIYVGWGEVFHTEDEYAEALKAWRYTPFQEDKKRSSWILENLKDAYEIERPAMPNRSNARYRFWKIRFEKILPFLNDEDLVLIWYSLWGIFLVKYLSENIFPKKISQLHLVAPVFADVILPSGDHFLADFLFDSARLKNLESQVDNIYLYRSKDDPLVPFSYIQKYHEYLPQAELFVFEDRGHFWQPEFKELLDNIRK